jgi:hypothetical protein
MTTGLKLTIFLASSRSNGNTSKLAQAVAAERKQKLSILINFLFHILTMSTKIQAMTFYI